MSWSKIFAGLLVLLLTGCGFQAMHSQYLGAPTQPEMNSIKIALIEDRIGQELRNALLDRLTPKGQPDNPLYELTVKLSKNSSELGIRKDETATRANLTVNASLSLFDHKSRKMIFSDSLNSTVSYNIMEARYATTAAERNAEQRAAIELADAISGRLAAFFSRTKRGYNQTYQQ